MPDWGGRGGSFNTSTSERGNGRHGSAAHSDSHHDGDASPGRLADIDPGTGLPNRAVHARHSVSNSGADRHPYPFRGYGSAIGWEGGDRPLG